MNPEFWLKISGTIISILLVLYLSLVSIPNLYFKTETGVVEKTTQIKIKTNFGSLEAVLLQETKLARENFIYISYHKLYDGNSFHRITNSESFKVIQAGDLGFEAKTFADEIWKKAPEEYSPEEQFELNKYQKKEPTPELLAPEYYKISYNEEFGMWENVYKKGLLVMANAGKDTNSSQFFITLEDTILQPNYTVFGYIKPESFGVLDKINIEVYPINIDGERVPDGQPNQEIIIQEVTYKPHTVQNFIKTKFDKIKNKF